MASKGKGKVIGYARVSTMGQSLEVQTEQLEKYGCDFIFAEKESGANKERLELQKVVANLKKDDTLVVTKIDRLARSVLHLQELVKDFMDKGINIVFLKENIDFSTKEGRLLFNMLSSVAEFERDLIKERTTEGRERAKQQGKHMGRRSVADDKAIKKALQQYSERDINGMSINDICKVNGVPKSTLYSYIRKQQQ